MVVLHFNEFAFFCFFACASSCSNLIIVMIFAWLCNLLELAWGSLIVLDFACLKKRRAKNALVDMPPP